MLASCSISIQGSNQRAQAVSCSFPAFLGHHKRVSAGPCITPVAAYPCPSPTPISSLRPPSVFVGSQAESKQVGQSIFRRSLLNRLQQEYKDREELRSRSLQAWICYVTFICNIFDYLRVRSRSRSSQLLLPRAARRATRLDRRWMEPQGSAVGAAAGSQHEDAAGVGASHRQANRLGEAEPPLRTVTKAELPDVCSPLIGLIPDGPHCSVAVRCWGDPWVLMQFLAHILGLFASPHCSVCLDAFLASWSRCENNASRAAGRKNAVAASLFPLLTIETRCFLHHLFSCSG